MNKLLALLALGQSMYGRWCLQRIALGLMFVASLIMVASIMVSAIVIIGLYATYHGLLNANVDPRTALVLVSTCLISLTLLLILGIFSYLRHLRTIPRRLLQEKIPSASAAGSVVDAFLEGFRGVRVKEPS